jgi:hypothetical protein
MTRAQVISTSVVAVHHLIAIYSVSAERFSLPIARFASDVLFPAVLILNAVPLAIAGGAGAMVDKLTNRSSINAAMFVVLFVLLSSVQWALVGILAALITKRQQNSP